MTVVVTQPTARSTRSLLAHPAVLLGALGGTIGFVGSWSPSYWGDEAASVLSASRPLPSLLSELSTIDAVHGMYYAFLHVWTMVFGTSELATRLPSAIAVGFMVAGVVVLVRELSDQRTALVAGAILIVLPRTTYMAIEARSYAMGAAAAVWVTVLLLRLVRRRGTAAAWLTYGLAMTASIYLFLYLGLLLLVHAVVVGLVFRRYLGPWLRAAALAIAVSLPIIVLGYQQRDQIRFLAHRNYATPLNVIANQWFGGVPATVIAWALILAAIVAVVVTRRRRVLTIIAAVWLVLPTALLLAGNWLVSPMYNVRYLSFSTPAAAILMACGVVAIARRFGGRRVVTAGLIAVIVAACAPVYLAQRSATAKDGGSDWRQVSQYLDSTASAGDAVVFDQTTKPSRDPRLALRLYPAGFDGLADVGLVTRYDLTSGIWDQTRPISQTSFGGYTDVWAVELTHGSQVPDDISDLEARGFVVQSSQLIHRTTVYHLTKE